MIAQQDKSPNLRITVCICTYNRSEKIARLLSDIDQNLLIPQDCQVDFFCIDNNSTDETAKVIQQFQLSFLQQTTQLHYRLEKQQGLSHARNLALRQTNAEWLIFIDDDVILDKNWLLKYCHMIHENPEAGFLGGRILLNWLQPKPKWLKNEDMALLSGVLCKYDLGEGFFKYKDNKRLPFGASFAISRRLINKVGFFRADLGVAADKQGRGEDTDYLSRAINQGETGYYCHDAVCFHDALEARLTTQYLYEHGCAKGKAEYLIGNKLDCRKVKQINIAIKALWQLIKGRRDLYLQGIINLGMLRGYSACLQAQGRNEA